MIIGIDGNEANVAHRVGISEYAFELLKQFAESRVQNLEFRIYLKNQPLKDLPQETQKWNYKVIGPQKLWTQIGLPLSLYTSSSKPDVFFTPTHYAPRFSPIPTVISIMDLAFIHYPELFKSSDLYQLTNWTKYSVKNAKKILTISKASRSDIIKIYKVPEDRVVVTYPGIKNHESEIMNNESQEFIIKKSGIGDKFILFVGTLQPRKNIQRLIEAFSKLKIKDLQLVIVGKKGWLYEEILNAPKKFQVADSVKFLEFVTDEELEVLYKHAQVFVLPSLYEGFGLPVLEAMKYGCPVITSNVSSLPEAGGDAALYVDPEQVDDVAEKIKKVLGDPHLRKSMIQKGYAHIKNFNWEKTAKETLSVLQEVASR